MEDLSLDSLLSIDEVDDLYGTDETEFTLEDDTLQEKEDKKNPEDTKEDDEELFSDDDLGGDIENQEDTKDNKDEVSPNFYSSIASAFVEDGILSDVSEEDIANIKDASEFKELIEKQIQSQLDERTKRVEEALNAGVNIDEFKQYENTVNYLNNITDTLISEDTEEGENLRKQLIYTELINRGYSKERSLRELEKSFNAGTDIDDAKDALAGNKEFYQTKFDSLIKEKQDAVLTKEKEFKAECERMSKSILEDKTFFTDLELDKSTRKLVLDNINKPVYTDPETKQRLTVIQKYEKENKSDFVKNVGILFTLTDGFKNMDKLVKDKVKKETNKGIKDLETKLKTTGRRSGGDLSLLGDDLADTNSKVSNWELDLDI